MHHKVCIWRQLESKLKSEKYGFNYQDGSVLPAITDKPAAPPDTRIKVRCSCQTSKHLANLVPVLRQACHAAFTVDVKDSARTIPLPLNMLNFHHVIMYFSNEILCGFHTYFNGFITLKY